LEPTVGVVVVPAGELGRFGEAVADVALL
jgi:hypothetical protein